MSCRRIFFSSLYLFVFLVLISACVSRDTSVENWHVAVERDDPAWVAQFKRTLGARWYTVSMFGVDVGRAVKQRMIIGKNGFHVFRIHHNDEILLQVNGTTNRIDRTVIKEFSATFPHNLINYTYTERLNDYEQILSIRQNTENSYIMRVVSDSKGKSFPLRTFSHTLRQEMELEMWVSAAEETDVKMRCSQLPTLSKALREKIDFQAVVTQVSHTDENDLANKNVDVEIRSDTGKFSFLSFDDKGLLRSSIEDGVLHYQFKSQQPGMPEAVADLYVRSMVPIAGKIGESEKIKLLHLRIEGQNIEFLEKGPTQQVYGDDQAEGILVTIDTYSNDSEMVDISAEEREKYTRNVTSTDAIQEEIARLAELAVGEIRQPAEKIEKLVEFVNGYLEYEFMLHSDLQQVIANRKGDCTEYARLFSELARSLGIPCRVVSGLAYMGDWSQGFALHAWNEVFTDGRWLAVDASTGSHRIPPIYIRFPDDRRKSAQLMHAVHNMKIQVEKVEFTNEKNN